MPPSDGVEDGRPHLQADENNYTDLRFSCQYDNPLEGEGGPKIGTILPNVAATLFGDNDLTSSDDSSDENDVIESYEHLQCPVPSHALYVQYPYCGDSVR